MKLIELGWNERFSALFEPYRLEGLVPARVVAQHRGAYALAGETGEVMAEVSGRFRHRTSEPAGFPAVGDWVALELLDRDRGVIHAVLERRSAFVRKAAGPLTEAQLVAANVDIVFLVTGLDGDFNLRRIERYLTAARASGASPVIVLNKSDLRDDVAEVAANVAVFVCQGAKFRLRVLRVKARPDSPHAPTATAPGSSLR